MKKIMFVVLIGLMVSMFFGCDDTGDEAIKEDNIIKTFAYRVTSYDGSQKPWVRYKNAGDQYITILPQLPWSLHSTVAILQSTGKSVYFPPSIDVYNLTDKTSIEVTIFLNGKEYLTQNCDGIYCIIHLTVE